MLIDGTALVTGEVERVTAFERGRPGDEARVGGSAGSPTPGSATTRRSWRTWPGARLVVLSGCSHAGAINVLRQAQRLTGVERIHALVGGMHCPARPSRRSSGRPSTSSPRSARTGSLPATAPAGGRTTRSRRRMPGAFVKTAVGTRLRFAAGA